MKSNEHIDVHKMQEELEIEQLLKDFEGKDIPIPEERLENALEEKLQSLHKTKKKPLAKIAVGLGVALLAGSFLVPEVQVFAQEVLENIFKDKGIEQAVQLGYPSIADVEGKIGDYKVRLTNIYIDAMRFSFDIEIKDLPKEKEDGREFIYFCNIGDDWKVKNQKLEIGISSSSFTSGERTSIEVIGEDVSKILAEEKVEVPFVLTNNEYDPNGPNNEKVLGETILTLTIPDELRQEPKVYEISESVNLEGVQICMETLKVAPTMMTLDFISDLKGGYITGLKNIKLLGKEAIYEEGVNLGATYDQKGGFRATMVPSIYFQNETNLSLEADGYWYKPNEMPTLTIANDGKFPKEIVYDGIPLTITTFNYKDGLLEVGILNENYEKYNFGEIYINGIDSQSMEIHTYKKDDENGNITDIMVREYITKIKVPEAETYELGLDYDRYKEEAISMTFTIE